MSTPLPPAPGPFADSLADRTCALLAAHVPLSLLMDLADPAGPHSWDLMHAEPQAADWLPPARG